MKHDIEQIRETLRRAHTRNEIRAEWPMSLTEFGTTTAGATQAFQAMADSFVTLAEANRKGLDIKFTIREP